MTATTNQTTSNGNGNTTTNGNGSAEKGSKAPRQMTAPEAIGKINKILEQLSPADQKRVMAFFNATTE